MSHANTSALNLPCFSAIKPELIERQLDSILEENRADLAKIISCKDPYTWDNLFVSLEEISNRLDQFWSPISHLNSVMNEESLRKVYEACIPKLSAFHTEIGQNEGLYRAVESLSKSNEFKKLDSAQQKVVSDALLDFKLSGIGLPEAKKERYAAIQAQLSLLMNKFEQNLMDASDNWTYQTDNVEELAGLPEHIITAAKETAERENQTGYVLTLEIPCYHAVLTYAENAELRRIFYFAYTTRASDQGPDAGKWDNSTVIQEIMGLRLELAQLLGYKNFAELSLVTKMAKEPSRVMQFLNDLSTRIQDIAHLEFSELRQFALEQYGVKELNVWDSAYYSEKLRQYRYSITEEELRPYFPLDRVLYGVFNLVNKLFGIEVTEIADIDIWHPEVKFFAVYDQQKNLRGHFYLDLFARPHKRGGAWMDGCRDRRLKRSGEIQTPVAYLTCNFTPPTLTGLALLNHDEVITLLHEFGHVLHHIITQINYSDVSGINGVEWDAVEFPSQFLENWCWQEESMKLFSGHYQTGADLPADMFKRLHAAKNFHSGMHLARQLELSLFDFRIHQEFDPQVTNQVQQILNEVREKVSVTTPPAFNRFQHSFSHIFAGSYSAGYYSYLWAEVLASDAFALFESEGIFNATTGQQYMQNILEKGGSKDAMELYTAFRGREPTIDAFLRHQGLVR